MTDPKYMLQTVPTDKAFALARLIWFCEENDVEIEKVAFFNNGFTVIFKNLSGDAICHDGSLANRFGMWETMGMPWDRSNVSVHDPEALAKMLSALKKGEDWQKYEKESL